MPTFKRKVPLGRAIRWSKMSGDMLLELATPVPEKGDIEEGKAKATPELRPLNEAGLRDLESDII